MEHSTGREVTVTYLHHSGFLVKIGQTRLIFDYSGGPLDPNSPESQPVLAALNTPGTLCFASHAHGDHFSEEIVNWAGEGRASLVLSDDIRPGLPALYIAPGQEFVHQGVRIRAFGSTDQGVSFWVEAEGVCVFHAGDLNLWHWREQSTLVEVEQAWRHFTSILDTMPRTRADIAFFPVDGRLGAGHDDGAVYYARRFSPQYLFPMHWWDNEDIPRVFAGQHIFESTQVVPLVRRGQHITLTI